MRKSLIFSGIILLYLLVWGAAGLWSSLQFGNAGVGGTLLLGFAAVPVVIRVAVYKIFKTDSNSNKWENR